MVANMHEYSWSGLYSSSIQFVFAVLTFWQLWQRTFIISIKFKLFLFLIANMLIYYISSAAI